ncbi:MAG TPA: addiction module protein [Thermoanaerobaculia bacterium]
MELPLEDRLEIAQSLWDSAVPQPEIELTDEQKALLEGRRAAFLADPGACDSWEVVKARILAKL